MVIRSAFRDSKNYRLGVASEWAAPFLRTAARLLVPGAATPPSAWRKGLIVGAAHIGDVLYRTASLPHLRRLLPDCRWHYLAGERSAPVLGNNPHLAAVFPWCSGSRCDSIPPERLSFLRAEKYDAILCTDANAYWADYKLALSLRIPNRAGFVHRGLSALATHPVPCAYPSPWPRYFHDMVRHLGGSAETWDLRPQVFPDADDEAAAAAAWESLGFDPARPVIACAAGTRSPQAVLPPGRMAEMVNRIAAAVPLQAVLCGSADEAVALGEIAAGLRCPARVLAGDLGLRALAAFLRRCRLFLGSDSGPRHLANAAGIPVFYFRGFTSSRIEVGNYCATETDLSPPFERGTASDHRKRLAEVDPETAVGPVIRLLASP